MTSSHKRVRYSLEVRGLWVYTEEVLYLVKSFLSHVFYSNVLSSLRTPYYVQNCILCTRYKLAATTTILVFRVEIFISFGLPFD